MNVTGRKILYRAHSPLFVRILLLFVVAGSPATEVISAEETAAGSDTAAKCNLFFDGHLYSLTPDEFYLSACAICYKFLPSDPNRDHQIKTVMPQTSERGVKCDGKSICPRWITVWTNSSFHLKNNETNLLVVADPDAALSSETSGPVQGLWPRELGKWRECCVAARRWCHGEVAAPHNAPLANRSETQGNCPSIWDGWSSWPQTPSGTLVHGVCPSYIRYSSLCRVAAPRRHCYVNGIWERHVDSYCLSSKKSNEGILELMAEYAVSISFLLPALAIFFLLYRQLQGHRIMLHRNLFISLLLHALSEVLFQTTVILPSLEHVTNKKDSLTNPSKQDWVCIFLFVATKYFRCSSFMWMFCEGFYLHRLLAAAFAPDGSLVVFYVIGWGLPILPTAVYSFLRGITSHERCWINSSNYEWVLIVPNITSLLANMVFLVSILRVLTQLRKPSDQEPSHYRRAVRATLLLVPLLGLHFVLTLYRPPRDHCVWVRVHQVLDHALTGLQGAVVACLFCFFNSEVHELFRRARRTLVDRYQPGLRPSRGSHSFSTAQATLVTAASAPAPRNT